MSSQSSNVVMCGRTLHLATLDKEHAKQEKSHPSIFPLVLVSRLNPIRHSRRSIPARDPLPYVLLVFVFHLIPSEMHSFWTPESTRSYPVLTQTEAVPMANILFFFTRRADVLTISKLVS